MIRSTKRYILHHLRWLLDNNQNWVRYRKTKDYNIKLMKLLSNY